jgi:PDZ domain-containing secreted protein
MGSTRELTIYNSIAHNGDTVAVVAKRWNIQPVTVHNIIDKVSKERSNSIGVQLNKITSNETVLFNMIAIERATGMPNAHIDEMAMNYVKAKLK